MMTLAPELPGALDVVRRLTQHGVVVSLGHSDATFAQASEALDAGATAGTHLFNAMRPLHHREPGLAGALLTDSRATPGLIADGVHVHPAAVRLAYRARGPAGLALATDAISAAGMPEGSYALGTLSVHVHGREARLADGTLAGSVLTMDAAIRNVAAYVGCGVQQAVWMATTSPARVLGLHHKGSLEPGADADLVILSPNLLVQKTYVAGRLVFEA
jgi:N-acetylglucosamine-6-phosphate deacetylase